MIKRILFCCIVAIGMMAFAKQSDAVPVDLELIIATDTSGSVDGIDFALRRSGIEAVFRDADIISAIESGVIGSIAVTLWDFGDTVSTAVGWTQISSAFEANAFADLVAGATRGITGINDGQINMFSQAGAAIANDFEATRSLLDIISEGVDSGDSFTLTDRPDVKAAAESFITAGGSAVNAIWMRDRDFFGLHAEAIVNAFEYGIASVLAGTDAFQVFAETNEDFTSAFKDKILREITGSPVPEPATVALLGIGLVGLAGVEVRRRRKKKAVDNS